MDVKITVKGICPICNDTLVAHSMLDFVDMTITIIDGRCEHCEKNVTPQIETMTYFLENT